MGKVQDTISRIGQRLKQRPRADVALIIPSQHKPTRHSFPTTYQGVSRWLDTQADTNPETSVATLLKALQHSNRLKTSPAERLRITDLFRTSLISRVPQLNSQFIGMDLPYGTTGQFAFEQVTALLQELSYGYKIALADALLGKGKLTRKYRVYAIFRAMMAIGECGLRHSQSYCQWPEKSWRDINSLMLLAENEHAASDKIDVDGKAKQSRPNTIQQLYKALAVFSISKTSHIQPLQMDSLFIALCKHSDSIELWTERPALNPLLFSVALNSDNPPSIDIFCRHRNNDKIRFLGLQKLSDALLVSDSIEQNQSTLSKQQITKLNQIWSQVSTRSHGRSIRHAAFSTELGVKDIACSLKAFSGSEPAGHNIRFQTDWTLINESKTGIGLLSMATEAYRASVGEIVAYRAEYLTTNTCICHIGIIRWIQNEGNQQLRIGVQTISEAAQAAAVERSGHEQSADAPLIEALLYPEKSANGNQLMLLLPKQQFKLGETINLHCDNSEYTTQMKLAEKLEISGNFDCFALKNATTKSVNTIQAVMQRAAGTAGQNNDG